MERNDSRPALAGRATAGLARSEQSPRGGQTRPHGRVRSYVGLAQLVAVALIAVGWSLREERWVVPERSAGYWLGITGLAAMVLLLGYPLRKRLRWLRHAGPIARWFQIHMILGLIGPVAILYHANFRLGSTNANVALFCTLLVAASGVVGRVIYVRIHTSLSGRRRTLADLRDSLAQSQNAIRVLDGTEPMVQRLADYERRLLDPDRPLHRRLGSRLLAGGTGRRLLRDLRRQARRSARRHPAGDRWASEVSRLARQYVRTARSVASYHIWERSFALWHVAHLPLSFLLYATAAAHVVAVHLY